MSTNREKFVPGEYYHIYSRIILNTPEFKDNQVAERLALIFLVANSMKSSEIFQYLRNNNNSPQEKILEIVRQGEKIIDILCYSIMPDHYHLLLREKKENGIYRFMHKCNTSIAKYINVKKDRVGPLFESRFKAKHVDSNVYLLHLSAYIHLNPLDFLIGKTWREHKIRDWNSARKKLLGYPWSSLEFYINENSKNPIISGANIIKKQFVNNQDYESFMRDWAEEELPSEMKSFLENREPKPGVG